MKFIDTIEVYNYAGRCKECFKSYSTTVDQIGFYSSQIDVCGKIKNEGQESTIVSTIEENGPRPLRSQVVVCTPNDNNKPILI